MCRAQPPPDGYRLDLRGDDDRLPYIPLSVLCWKRVNKMLAEVDRQHLERCVRLAEQALEAGDEPFGSVLVDADGNVLQEAVNRAITGDATRHPEFDLARWAAVNMPDSRRRGATVYTSGEHCPMCSAAHAWAGLGRIVFASSSRQLGMWLDELGVATAPIQMHPVSAIAPGVAVEGPEPELAEQVRQLHHRLHGRV